MKKVLIITSALLLSATMSFAGQAGDVTIIGDTKDNTNTASGMSSTAVQQVKAVNVVGSESKVGDVTIIGDTGDNVNAASTMGSEAKQKIQSVNVE